MDSTLHNRFKFFGIFFVGKPKRPCLWCSRWQRRGSSPSHYACLSDYLVFVSLRSWADTRAIVQLEGLDKCWGGGEQRSQKHSNLLLYFLQHNLFPSQRMWLFCVVSCIQACALLSTNVWNHTCVSTHQEFRFLNHIPIIYLEFKNVI
jgi:hypothetical protein